MHESQSVNLRWGKIMLKSDRLIWFVLVILIFGHGCQITAVQTDLKRLKENNERLRGVVMVLGSHMNMTMLEMESRAQRNK